MHFAFVLPFALVAAVSGAVVPATGSQPAVTSSQFHSQDEAGNFAFGYANPTSQREESGNVETGVVRWDWFCLIIFIFIYLWCLDWGRQVRFVLWSYKTISPYDRQQHKKSYDSYLVKGIVHQRLGKDYPLCCRQLWLQVQDISSSVHYIENNINRWIWFRQYRKSFQGKRLNPGMWIAIIIGDLITHQI